MAEYRTFGWIQDPRLSRDPSGTSWIQELPETAASKIQDSPRTLGANLRSGSCPNILYLAKFGYIREAPGSKICPKSLWGILDLGSSYSGSSCIQDVPERSLGNLGSWIQPNILYSAIFGYVWVGLGYQTSRRNHEQVWANA